MTSKLTREHLRERAQLKAKNLTYAISQSAFAGVRSELEEELQFLQCALACLEGVNSEPVAWTDEQELRDVEKEGCGYLFKANPITPHADPRRVILLYRHAQPAPVVPDAYVRDERGRMMLNGVCEPKIGFGLGWNACRAAMLQELQKVQELKQPAGVTKMCRCCTPSKPRRLWGRCQKQVNCCTPTLRRNPIAARRQTKDGFR